MASFKKSVGSSSEYDTVLERARFLREAFKTAEREKPSRSATLCASRFTFGSILILRADVFICLKYIQSNSCSQDIFWGPDGDFNPGKNEEINSMEKGFALERNSRVETFLYLSRKDNIPLRADKTSSHPLWNIDP